MSTPYHIAHTHTSTVGIWFYRQCENIQIFLVVQHKFFKRLIRMKFKCILKWKTVVRILLQWFKTSIGIDCVCVCVWAWEYFFYPSSTCNMDKIVFTRMDWLWCTEFRFEFMWCLVMCAIWRGRETVGKGEIRTFQIMRRIFSWKTFRTRAFQWWSLNFYIQF